MSMLPDPKQESTNADAFDAALGEPAGASAAPSAEERAAAALHNALTPAEKMPEAVRARMNALAEALTSSAGTAGRIGPEPAARPSRNFALWAAAAAVALASVSIFSWRTIQARDAELADLRTRFALAASQAQSNEQLLAEARSRVAALTGELGQTQSTLTERERTLAQTLAEQTALAERLAQATGRLAEQDSRLAQAGQQREQLSKELDEARLKIARFETPVDPATLAANRTKLLEVPGTVRVAWAPFDLPNNPAEQQTVQGDVIWNDKLQTGYLRFVGLKVNDPAVEQYQVWVIDERGLEQKVSGGVFNASADGEVIVPIEPGIAVGRVALFAVTVEKPGGTWVPDLKRRVVVAPRG